MRRKILDTNKLISHWRHSRTLSCDQYTPADARKWARKLIDIYQTNSIVTPVYLEMVGGVQDRSEMHLTKAFLDEFEIIDQGRITPEDWSKAREIAERIRTPSRARGAIDCLIKAIAIRFGCDIETNDKGMPRR